MSEQKKIHAVAAPEQICAIGALASLGEAMGNDVIAKHARDFLAACEKSTMNDQQQSRADALTGINQFLMDVVTAAGLLSHGRTDKKLATRITDQAYELRKRMYFLAASPVEQPALLTAQDALAAIETFEIVGDNNDSREPNAEDRFILTEFVAHLFGGFHVELPAAAPISSDPESRATAAQLVRDMMTDLSRTIEERDRAEEVGTRLANTVGEFLGVDVGEWSSANDPILAAIEALETRSPAMAAAAPADERAAFDLAEFCELIDDYQCAQKDGTHDERAKARFALMNACRAAASPAAEAVATVEVGSMEHGPFTFQTTPYGADTLPKGVHSLYAAPQPAQAASPAAEAREPMNEVLFGNDEALEMAADTLDRLGEDSAAAGVRAVAYELRMLAHKARCAPADAGEAASFGWAQPKGGNYFTRNELSAKRIGGLVPVYTAPPAARVASLTDEQRESIEHAATWLGRSEDLQNKAHAKRLCDLLNGPDNDR
ncbi:hypothetical protein X880_6057 [Burkholderia pseudomallei MSHR4032]|uniref:hypothetical protein n=1 Tax=Burkholderia pseudomallei TaxID=28450 RepID=UPI00053772B1|nr:hypothetical protein [Burkholderia pseudomallei]KGU91202.1 hypothetical protein X880_6057 [Burkholderia pseudomallei MSHR4032]